MQTTKTGQLAVAGPGERSGTSERSGVTGPTPVRLTTRGRCVVLVLVLVVAIALGAALGIFFGGSPASADNAVPPGSERIVVPLGETLWSLASDEGLEGRGASAYVDRLISVNSLASDQLTAGQVIYAPRP